MKDIYKNPAFYYILAPVVAVLWPLLVWGVYLPKAEDNWKTERDEYKKAQAIMISILKLDSDRLQYAGSREAAAEFDYINVVDGIASSYGISADNYKISSRPVTGSGGQKSQSAQVTLKEIDIARFAKFLSTIQLRWASLQCTKVKLTKKKGLPDTWKVDLEFKYYY
jgi:hypothetical protein